MCLSTKIQELEEVGYKTAEELNQGPSTVVLAAKPIPSVVVGNKMHFKKGFVAKMTNTYRGG